MKTKLTEKELKGKIYQMVNESLDEYRGHDADSDGDLKYIRPNGKDMIRNDQYKFHHNPETSKPGKRSKDNFRGGQGSHENSATITGSNALSNGKGSIIDKNILDCSIYKIGYNDVIGDDGTINGYDKVEWTENEKENLLTIKKKAKELVDMIFDLIRLTKEEGNEKRGYNGPKEEPEHSEEAEPALALNENDLAYVTKMVKEALGEEFDAAELQRRRQAEIQQKRDFLKQQQQQQPVTHKADTTYNSDWETCENPGKVQWGTLQGDNTQYSIDGQYRRQAIKKNGMPDYRYFSRRQQQA